MKGVIRKTTLVLIIFLGISGCAGLKPQPTDRQGLFDVFAGLEGSGRRVSGISGREIASIRNHASEWSWPLQKVVVTSEFGRRAGRAHEGIDLKARTGTPVLAAGSGKVVYSGSRIRGYGRMVVLDHGNDLFSVYAHHSKNLVKVGDQVRRGQRIARSGRSGRASGPHLHFEIRKGSKAINPRDVLR